MSKPKIVYVTKYGLTEGIVKTFLAEEDAPMTKPIAAPETRRG